MGVVMRPCDDKAISSVAHTGFVTQCKTVIRVYQNQSMRDSSLKQCARFEHWVPTLAISQLMVLKDPMRREPRQRERKHREPPTKSDEPTSQERMFERNCIGQQPSPTAREIAVEIERRIEQQQQQRC